LLDDRWGDQAISLDVAYNSFKNFHAGKTATSVRSYLDKLIAHCSLIRALTGDYNQSTILSTITDKLDIDWHRRLMDYKRQRVAPHHNNVWNVDEFVRVLNLVTKDEEELHRPTSMAPDPSPRPNLVPGGGAQHQLGGGQQPNRQSLGGRRQTMNPNALPQQFNQYQALDDDGEQPAPCEHCHAVPVFKHPDKNKSLKKSVKVSQPSAPATRERPKVGKYEKKGPNPPYLCPMCRKDHWMKKCKDFSDSTTRADRLREIGRCYKCAKTGHKGRDCGKNPSRVSATGLRLLQRTAP
jgi:hypothetical protein